MTGLLVSVRDAFEAKAALAGGADLIDIKEPANGPLGAASPACWQEVVTAVAGRRPVSIALGELVDIRAIDRESVLPTGIQLAKLGLASCHDRSGWQAEWRHWRTSLPASVEPVAVVYADGNRAHAPESERVVNLAAEFGCFAVLVDTYGKTEGSLVDHWSESRLVGHLEQVRSLGMKAVVAGSLDRRVIQRLPLDLVDLVAVRGAACRGDRTSAVDATAVEDLAALLAKCNSLAATGSRAIW